MATGVPIGGGATGLGHCYSSGSVTGFATGKLAEAVGGRDAFDVPLCHRPMVNAV